MGHNDSGEADMGKQKGSIGLGQCVFSIRVTDKAITCEGIDFGGGMPVHDPIEAITGLLRDGHRVGKTSFSTATFDDIKEWLATLYVNAVLNHARLGGDRDKGDVR